MALSTFVSRLVKEFESSRRRSRELFERAKRVLPGGVVYHIRFFEPYPVYVVRGRGTKVVDVDGYEYVDFWMGHGALMLGHLPKPLLEALEDVKSVGTHLGFPNEYAVEYAELLTKILPNVDMVRFCNSGTEANMYALRLARAYTRRKYVVKVEGGWHGGYDALHTAVSPPFKGPESAGLPEEYLSLTRSVPYNDIEALEKALKAEDVAAVVVEPVLGAAGCIAPHGNYLKELVETAHRYGTLVIFDEVITGFRLALGGAQQYFGVKADIVVLGKIVGGGVAGAGAIASRSEIMELLDHVKIPDPRKRSFHGGTFTGNPLTIIAGKKTVEYLSKNPQLYENLDQVSKVLLNELQRACEEANIECFTTGARGMIGIHFTKRRPINAREVHELWWSNDVYRALHKYSLLRGYLYLTEKNAHLLPSAIHTIEEAKGFVETFRSFLFELKRYLSRS